MWTHNTSCTIVFFWYFLYFSYCYPFSILNSGDPWTYAAGGGHTSCPILCKSNNGHRVQMQKCIPLVIQTHTSYCFVETIYTYVCLCFFLVYHLLLFLLHASKNWKATAFEIGEVLHSCICIYYVFQELGLHCKGIMINKYWQGKWCFSLLCIIWNWEFLNVPCTWKWKGGCK